MLLETDPQIRWTSDNGSVKPDSMLAGSYDIAIRAFDRMGRSLTTVDTFKACIEAAGFTNVQEKL